MKKIFLLFVIVFGIPTLFTLLSCSKKASDSNSGSNFFPNITFALPSSVSTSSAQNLSDSSVQPFVAGTNVLTEWGNKMTRTIDYINDFFTKLNSANITSGTSLSHTLANGNVITVSIGTIVNDANFQHQAVVCNNSNKFLYVKWNDAKDKVVAIRDFNYNPQTTVTTFNKNILVEVDYSVNASGDTTVDFYGNGEPWFVPTDVTSDGSVLVDHVTGVKKADGSYTFTGVNSWISTMPTSNANTGDNYGDVWLVGQLSSAGSGNFIVHRHYNSICNGITFSESSPTWCFGADITANGTPTYFNNTDADTAWSSGLQNIGVTNDSTLKYVSFPADLTCDSLP